MFDLWLSVFLAFIMLMSSSQLSTHRFIHPAGLFLSSPVIPVSWLTDVLPSISLYLLLISSSISLGFYGELVSTSATCSCRFFHEPGCVHGDIEFITSIGS